MMGGRVIFMVVMLLSLTGAEVPIPVQVVPQGIESVNGSDVNMGCASTPAGIGDVMLCGTSLADMDNATCGNYSGSESSMVDCNSPAIDTSTSNWASQLVTVRKNAKNDDINFDHVVLTFGFDTAVSPTAIELDLFLCPEWNIGTPYISVYADESKNTCGLVFSDSSVQANVIDFIRHYTPDKTSCDSLTNVSIPVQEQVRDSSYFTWHIVVSFDLQPDIEWVHVGEVTFMDVPAVCPNPSASVEIPGAEVQIPVQVVPQGIESRNGSDVNMGCASPQDSDSVVVCRLSGPCDSSQSYLSDGNSPAIDTSTSNWASQLVTVRKNDAIDDIPFDHVVLTFGFDTAVSLIAIELDLFLCPEWNIGAPYITLYADELKSNDSSGLVFSYHSVETGDLDFLRHYTPSRSSCDSLSTVSIALEEHAGYSSYFTWHIVVSFTNQPDIEWVHVGEVRISQSTAADNTNPGPSCSTQLAVSSTGYLTTSHLFVSSTRRLVSTQVLELTRSLKFDSVSSTIGLDSTQGHDMTRNLDSSRSVSLTINSTVTTIPIPTTATNIVAIVIGGFCALITLITFVAFAIGIFLYKKRRHPKIKLELQNAVSEPGRELHSIDPEKYRANNPLYQYPERAYTNIGFYPAEDGYGNDDYDGIKNPFYSTSVSDNPTAPLYDEVARDDFFDKINTYAEVSHNVPFSSAPTESAPEHFQAEQAETDHVTPIYSDVHMMDTPAIPPKSSALIEYLAVQDTEDQSTSSPRSKKMSQPGPHSPPLLYCNNEQPIYQNSINTFQQSIGGENLHVRPPSHPTTSPLNGDIYPSDFTYQESESTIEVDGDPHAYAPIYAVPTGRPEDFQQPVEITSDNIKEKKDLGTGQFGQVVLAATNGLSLKDMRLSSTDDNQDISILVAVKKLKSNPSLVQRETFEKEVKFMSRLKHPNVVYFLGVCYCDPAFIIMEYMEEGDLSQFLQRYSEIVPITTPSNNAQITTSTVVHMASQIASAMKYLASLNIIHRDLASRNCLVGSNFTVKLSDFGMSRSLYESSYYKVQGKVVLPIRWLPTECFYGKFTEKSDVWAFGITMWELFTLAKEEPYPNLSDEDVVEDAIKGEHRQLLSRPAACPKPVYKIMQRCWAFDTNQRASFQELDGMLQT